jgi:polysaccharide export outer membrane protein
MKIQITRHAAALALAALLPAAALAQTPAPAPAAVQPAVPQAPGAQDPTYVIGTDDVLAIVFWELPSHSAEVVVRPDGKITLPLLNDVAAAGLTPDQLRASITTAAAKFIREPAVSVIVKTINSRKVFVSGQVARPGTYALTSPTTVLQLLALAGGPTDFAKKKKIAVMRTENGQTARLKFNYNDVLDGKNLEQNVLLKPGDTVVVP